MAGFEPLFPSAVPAGATTADDAAPAGFKPMFSAESTAGFQPLLHDGGPAAAPAEAPVDLDVLLAEARAEGAAEARAELQAQRDELEATVAALAPALAAAETAHREALQQAAEDIGRILIALAEQAIGDSLAAHPDALIAVVKQALSTLPDDDELRIRVATGDADRVRAALPERFRPAVVGDEAVQAGCRVEARHASIDATLEAAVAGTRAAIQTWLEART